METNMQKTWKPTTAGILDLVTAIISLWFLLAVSLEGAVFWSIFPKSLFGLNNLATAYFIIVIPLLCMDILAFIGGICALKRRKWKLTLTGSVATIFSWIPVVLLIKPAVIFGTTVLSIIIVLLVIKSKCEFE